MFELFSFKQKNQKKYKKVHYIKKSTKNKTNQIKQKSSLYQNIIF